MNIIVKDDMKGGSEMAKLSSTCELSEKDVINLCDGARLGHACDFEFDVRDGKICAIIVCRETGFLGFGGEQCFVINWERIECIGEDAVLVRIPPDELCACERDRKKDKKR